MPHPRLQLCVLLITTCATTVALGGERNCSASGSARRACSEPTPHSAQKTTDHQAVLAFSLKRTWGRRPPGRVI